MGSEDLDSSAYLFGGGREGGRDGEDQSFFIHPSCIFYPTSSEGGVAFLLKVGDDLNICYVNFHFSLSL